MNKASINQQKIEYRDRQLKEMEKSFVDKVYDFSMQEFVARNNRKTPPSGSGSAP